MPDPGDSQGCARPIAFLAAGLLIVAIGFIAFVTAYPEFLDAIFQGAEQVQEPGRGPNQPGNPPVGPNGVPAISERYFDLGTSHADVTGAFSLSGDLAIDTVASYVTNQGRATIVFGPPDPSALLVQVTFNEPEDTVTVTQGVLRATGMDTECTFSVSVTGALVAGHISCPSIDAFDGDELVGQSSIELEFSAGSLEGDDGNPDGDGTDPAQ